jgi:[protein-PII] uridylyltransferase
MAKHLEKVLKHAESKLIRQAHLKSGDLLDLYRRFLKIEEHRLWLNHKAGEGGEALGRKRSDLITVILKHLYEGALEGADRSHAIEPGSVQMALVAVGGFGREVLSPESDIDLMILHESYSANSAKARYVEDVIEHILYMLWDVGLKVGHSSRDIDEAIRQGKEDFQNSTAMMDARYISGDETLVQEFKRRFHRLCIKGKERAFLQWRMKDQDSRHAKFGNTVFLQEPHVKNGCGGLRDYHHLLWVAQVAQGIDSLAGIQKAGWLSASERKEVERAVDFITRVRNALHYHNQRPTEILSLGLQGEVARQFGYPHRSILRKTEALMKDYYEHSFNLFHLCNLASRRMSGLELQKNGLLQHLVPKKMRKEKQLGNFLLRDGELSVADDSLLAADPRQIVHAFQLAQRHRAELSAELELSVRKASRHLTRTNLRQPEYREMVLDILSRKGEVGRTIRLMHQTRVLGKLIPEFQPLTCLVQHEFYHRYTADEHTLVCLEQLDRVLDTDEFPYRNYRGLLEECDQSDLLYLALILHDTGKAANTSNHAEVSTQLAVKCARRLRVRGDRLNTLTFLVDHHSTLTEFACRKNLDDPYTTREFAQIVGNQERLDLLMLLSFADGKGTGDSNWSNWKEGLVWQLYNRAKRVLSGEKEFSEREREEQKRVLMQVRSNLGSTVTDEEFEAHFNLLPPTYLHYRNEELITQQIKLVHDFIRHQVNADSAKECLEPVIHWENRPSIGCSEVTVVTWDNERAFSKICGAFSVVGLMIVSADIWTRKDNILVDTFRVSTERFEEASNPYDREKFFEQLKLALADPRYDPVEHFPRSRRRNDLITADIDEISPEFGLDNDGSTDHTLLHVKAPDRLGLLYLVSNIISDHGLLIRSARITTEKGMAMDTFYLQEPEGEQLEDRSRGAALIGALEKGAAQFMEME